MTWKTQKSEPSQYMATYLFPEIKRNGYPLDNTGDNKALFSVQILFGDVQRFSSDIDVLVLTEPGELSKTTLYAIDQFILRGGRVLAFLDPFNETLDVSKKSTFGS